MQILERLQGFGAVDLASVNKMLLRGAMGSTAPAPAPPAPGSAGYPMAMANAVEVVTASQIPQGTPNSTSIPNEQTVLALNAPHLGCEVFCDLSPVANALQTALLNGVGVNPLCAGLAVRIYGYVGGKRQLLASGLASIPDSQIPTSQSLRRMVASTRVAAERYEITAFYNFQSSGALTTTKVDFEAIGHGNASALPGTPQSFTQPIGDTIPHVALNATTARLFVSGPGEIVGALATNPFGSTLFWVIIDQITTPNVAMAAGPPWNGITTILGELEIPAGVTASFTPPVPLRFYNGLTMGLSTVSAAQAAFTQPAINGQFALMTAYVR